MYLKFTIAFLVSALMFSISSYAQRNHLSQFWYNGKRHNSLIVARVPDYGDGHADGCIRMGEIKLTLQDIDEQTIEGMVKDVNTGKPLLSVISIFRKDGSSDTIKTDGQGRFVITKSFPVSKIKVQSHAYRTLQVERTRKALF